MILKQRKGNKFTAKFELEPYTVIERKGTKIVVAENRRHTVTRNASFFKRKKGDVIEPDEDEYFKDRATTTEMNNEVQASMNMDVQAPTLRRSTRNRIQREQYGNPINPDLTIH